MRPKPPVAVQALDRARLLARKETSALSTAASKNAQGRKNKGVPCGRRSGHTAARSPTQVKLALPPAVSVLAAEARIAETESSQRAMEPPGVCASNETPSP